MCQVCFACLLQRESGRRDFLLQFPILCSTSVVTWVSMATQFALGGQELGRAVSRATVMLPDAASTEYLRECVLLKQIPGCPTAFL